MTAGIVVWAIGAVGCMALALTHPRSWPYTPKSWYSQRVWDTRTIFWAGRVLLAALWPIAVVALGVTALWDELT